METSTISEGRGRRLGFDRIRETVQSTVNESVLPTEEGLGFESTVGIYGGRLVKEPDGKLVYDMTGVVSRLDKVGDVLLRTYDEHLAKRPLKIVRHALKGHWRGLGRFVPWDTFRARGTPREIAQNVARLGLSDYYGLHRKGIEIKKREVFTHGLALQDIYRQESIAHGKTLQGIDRFQALADAAHYIREIHDKYGAIGELLASDIIFQQREGDQVVNPVLNIPDEVYNPEKTVSEDFKKATEMLDFLINIGFEEFRRSNDWSLVDRALQTIIEGYGESRVISVVGSFVRRGRLTTDGTLPTRRPFMQHNQARIRFDPRYIEGMRQSVIRICLNARG